MPRSRAPMMRDRRCSAVPTPVRVLSRSWRSDRRCGPDADRAEDVAMSLMFLMRFDLRNPAIAKTSMADRYAAALDMAEWADRVGCLSVVVSEHHGSEDGYLPSPLPMVAAMAARTERVRFGVAALIAPFYEPLRLAEDLLVLDHLSKGRVDLIVAGGYVRQEF